MTNDPVDNLTIIEIYEMVSGYKVGTNRRRDRKSDGDVYMVMCCFHADNDPSLQLFTATNGYYCYGCKKKGGKLQAVIAAGHAPDYNDAADWLRKQLGMPARERPTLREQPAAAIEITQPSARTNMNGRRRVIKSLSSNGRLQYPPWTTCCARRRVLKRVTSGSADSDGSSSR